MRTAVGPTDHVVIVGAGLGGLSAALRLLGTGRRVTVVEREPVPGGRAGLLELGGFRFDTGPTVLTLPHLIEQALGCVDERISDWLELRRLDPAYRARFADGSTIDVHTDIERMSDEIRDTCGPASAQGYRRFVEFARELYDLEMPHFIDRNLDSPLDLANLKGLRLLRIGGFRKLGDVVADMMPDARLQRIFSFQSMYAGLSPQNALAIYAVIAYMDCVKGVFHPVGGMHAVPRALADAAAKHGADFRYETTATRVEFNGDRAVAVHTAGGERIRCDAVVLNPDLPWTWQILLADRVPPRRLRRRPGFRYSPSCVVLHAGSTLQPQGQAHHTIHFGKAWRRTFDELIDRRVLMSDPSLLVSVPTVTDASIAPADRSVFYVLAPTPNTDADIDWSVIGPRYRDELVGRLDQLGYAGFDSSIEVESSTTPADWAAAGLARGTPFALSHAFWQTGPFRPRNLEFDNVVFAGSGTQPGVGVPMVLVSGRLAAERIIGLRAGAR
jgi:phytoene desaturase